MTPQQLGFYAAAAASVLGLATVLAATMPGVSPRWLAILTALAVLVASIAAEQSGARGA
jgi:hypothetical protein